jgi:hypothetical protein
LSHRVHCLVNPSFPDLMLCRRDLQVRCSISSLQRRSSSLGDQTVLHVAHHHLLQCRRPGRLLGPLTLLPPSLGQVHTLNFWMLVCCSAVANEHTILIIVGIVGVVRRCCAEVLGERGVEGGGGRDAQVAGRFTFFLYACRICHLQVWKRRTSTCPGTLTAAAVGSILMRR